MLTACMYRAMNSVLVAQGITQPQMWVSVVVVPLHVITNKIFIYHLGYGYLGAAIAMSLSAAYVLVLNSIWIAATGMTPRVWGTCSTWLIIWVSTCIGSTAGTQYMVPRCLGHAASCMHHWQPVNECGNLAAPTNSYMVTTTVPLAFHPARIPARG